MIHVTQCTHPQNSLVTNETNQRCRPWFLFENCVFLELISHTWMTHDPCHTYKCCWGSCSRETESGVMPWISHVAHAHKSWVKCRGACSWETESCRRCGCAMSRIRHVTHMNTSWVIYCGACSCKTESRRRCRWVMSWKSHVADMDVPCPCHTYEYVMSDILWRVLF